MPSPLTGRIGSGSTLRPAQIARSATAEEARQKPACHPSRRAGPHSPSFLVSQRGIFVDVDASAVRSVCSCCGKVAATRRHRTNEGNTPCRCKRSGSIGQGCGGLPDLARPVEAHRKTILPPKCPPGNQPTSTDTNRRPPSAGTLARFPQLAGPLTCSYHGQTLKRVTDSLSKNGSDLRAPLQNRTVDLLLTIYPRVHAVANCGIAGQARGGPLCCRPTYLVIKPARLGADPFGTDYPG